MDHLFYPLWNSFCFRIKVKSKDFKDFLRIILNDLLHSTHGFIGRNCFLKLYFVMNSAKVYYLFKILLWIFLLSKLRLNFAVYFCQNLTSEVNSNSNIHAHKDSEFLTFYFFLYWHNATVPACAIHYNGALRYSYWIFTSFSVVHFFSFWVNVFRICYLLFSIHFKKLLTRIWTEYCSPDCCDFHKAWLPLCIW